MRALAEIQIEPIGAGVSMRDEIERARQILSKNTPLEVEPHATGTNVGGELPDVLAAVYELHNALHAQGAERLSTLLKIETRTDKLPPSP